MAAAAQYCTVLDFAEFAQANSAVGKTATPPVTAMLLPLDSAEAELLYPIYSNKPQDCEMSAVGAYETERAN